MSNFVKVVGYQLEKVHTGVIKWCLDSGDNIPFSNPKFNALLKLYHCLGKDIPFKKCDVTKVKCRPEYSFGRKIRIDLFIEITTKLDNYYLACEMKVDSDPYANQLNQTVSMVERKFNSRDNTEYLLILLGASIVQRNIGDQHDAFHVISASDLIEIFSEIRNDSYIVSDWIDALSEELIREKNIIQNFRKLSSLGLWCKDHHINMGYRPFFSTFYYLYSEMRNHSSTPDSWHIYSGSNNPVMNWKNGWRTVGDFRFYWEFNYLEFCFKVNIAKESVTRHRLNHLRDTLYPLLESTSYQGRRSQKRYGEWNSIFKWDFDLSRQDSTYVFNKIEQEILPIYEQICSVAHDI